jgi:DNA (cytosine-5)-methyltransferase 1
MISYNNLWTTLDKCKITKTELRQRMGISSSTFAKLSSNQPVAIDIIEKICKELGCTPNDVMTILPESANTLDWSGIVDDTTYLIKIYFYRTANDVQYVYGFASPFHMTTDGLDKWKLSKHEELPDFLVIDGYAQDSSLRTIIQDACEHMTLGQIFNALNIKFTLNQCTNFDEDAISMLQLCNGTFTHRPIFILPDTNYCNQHNPVFRPLQSFDDSFMYCESLFGNDKEQLYYTDQQPDYHKAHMLWKLFQTEFSVSMNANEMARLNNFEVFSYLNGESDGNDGFHWEITRLEKDDRQIPESISFSFDHKFFNGQYALRVSISNTLNPHSDILKLIYCDEADYSFAIPLQESPTNIGIWLWKINPDSYATNLMHASNSTLIREFHLDMSISNRRFRIEDDWTRKMDSLSIDTKKDGEYVSHHPTFWGNTDNEPWHKSEERTQDYFRTMFSSKVNAGNNELFLEPGHDKHVRFLEWLSKTLRAANTHRVILIDPFVDVTTITKYLRCISNTSITYEIYTNADDNGKNRISNIISIKDQLDLLNPGKLKIATLPCEALHDRFLILLGDNSIPQVYSMSNSLDHLAQKHASVILPTSGESASKVYEYYIELLTRYKSEDKIDYIYDSTHIASKSIETNHVVTQVANNDNRHMPATFEDFKKQFHNDLASALESLAYMHHEEGMKCKEYMLSQKNESLIQALVALLQDYMQDTSGYKEQEPSWEKLSIAQLLLRSFDRDCQLLESASRMQEYCYEHTHGFHNWSTYYAAKELLQLDKNAYLIILSGLREQLQLNNTYVDARIYSLADLMLGFLAEALSLRQLTKDDTILLMNSDIPFLKALGITYTLSAAMISPYDAIPATLDYLAGQIPLKESLYTQIYQIKELQIRNCQKPNEYDTIEPVIDRICNQVVATVTHVATDTTSNAEFSRDELYQILMPLYFRNSEDICRIILGLFQNRYFTSGDATELLTELLLEKYNKGVSDSKLYVTPNDLSESCMITNYLYQIDKASIKQLKQKLAKLERRVGGRFYQAFLKTQNYSLWKCSIDLYGCMVYLELKLESLYQTKRSCAVTEYKSIAANYTPTLEKYSDIYGVLVQEYPEDITSE